MANVRFDVRDLHLFFERRRAAWCLAVDIVRALLMRVN